MRLVVVETVASDFVSEGIPFQRDEEEEKLYPFAMYSINYLPAEADYEIYYKELIAIIRVFEEWRPEFELIVPENLI